MNRISIKHLNNNHTDWLRSLSFYKQELHVLDNRLEEIAGKNSDQDMMKEVEHFQNQFQIQQSNIGLLSRDIQTNIGIIAKELQQDNGSYIDNGLVKQHDDLDIRFQDEERTVNALRQ